MDGGKKTRKDNRSEPLIKEHCQYHEIDDPITLWGKNMLGS
jgi:hypothetical protein